MKRAQGHKAVPKMPRKSWPKWCSSFLLKGGCLWGVEQLHLQLAPCGLHVPFSEGGCPSATVFQKQRWKPLLGHGSCPGRHAAWPQAPHCHSFHSTTCVSFSFHELLLFPEEAETSSSSSKTMDLDPASWSSQSGLLQHLHWCTQGITAAHTGHAGRKAPDLFACVVIWLQELHPKCPLTVRNSWNNKINLDLLNLCWIAQYCCPSWWWWRNGGCWKWKLALPPLSHCTAEHWTSAEPLCSIWTRIKPHWCQWEL